MKKAFFLILIFISLSAWAVDFDSAVDFSLELSDISDRNTAAEAADDSRVLILEGIAGKTVSIDGKDWLRLHGGEWIGTEEVRAYSCLLFVDDPAWSGNRYTGSRLLAAVRVLGWNSDSGEAMAEIIDFRILN